MTGFSLGLGLHQPPVSQPAEAPLSLATKWSTPATALGGHAGEVEIVLDVVAPDWTPSSTQYLFRKYGGAHSNRVWAAVFHSSGAPGLWMSNGVATSFNIAGATIPAADGERHMLRLRHSIVSDSHSYEHKAPDAETWTPLSSGAAFLTSSASAFTFIEVGVGAPAGTFAHRLTFADSVGGEPTVTFDAADLQPDGTVVCPVSGLVFTQA